MAELRLKILADLKQLKKDLKDLMKERFKIGVEGNARGAGKSEKKQTGLLDNIAGSVAKSAIWLAIIAGFFKALQPLFDLLQVGVNLIAVVVFKILRWVINELPSLLSNIWQNITDWISQAIDWIKSLPANIWNFLKELPGKIWGFMVAGFNFVKETIIGLWNTFKEWFPFLEKVEGAVKIVGSFIKELISVASSFFSDPVGTLKEGFSEVWEFLKEKLPFLEKIELVMKNVFEKIKEIFSSFFSDPVGKFKEALMFVVEAIKNLPAQIWSFMQRLPDLIGRALKGILSFGGGVLNSIFGRSNKNVGDAIITKRGDVVRTSPDDTIIAAKGIGDAGGSKTFNFYGVTPQEMIDLIKQELGQDKFTATRF